MKTKAEYVYVDGWGLCVQVVDRRREALDWVVALGWALGLAVGQLLTW